MTSQDKFESWAVEHLPHLYLTKTEEGAYASPITQTCFVGWSARDGEVEGLTAENASLRGSCKASGKDLATAVRASNKATKERDKLRAECESLRKDADKWKIVERCMDSLQSDERNGSIWTVCSRLLISTAHQLNSAISTVLEEGVTIDEQQIGDWRVTVERIDTAMISGGDHD